MRKLIAPLFTIIILLNCNSCKYEDLGQTYSIKDALKISAYVFNDETGGDYFIDYEYEKDETLYTIKQLNLNEAGLLHPMTYRNADFNVRIEFDGIIEVISEDEDIYITFDPKRPDEPLTSFDYSEIEGFEIKYPYEGFIDIQPLGAHCYRSLPYDISELPYLLGREYYLTINAYKFDNERTPMKKISELDLYFREVTVNEKDINRIANGNNFIKFQFMQI